MAEEKQKKAPPKKKATYLKNRDLLEEVIKCKEADKGMSDTLARMLTLLTAKYGRSGQFSGYTFNEDMQAYALMMLCKTWAGFKPERSNNAFAYYTQCIKSSFKQYLNREKVQRLVRDELLVTKGLNPSFSYTDGSDTVFNDRHYVHDEEDHGQIVQDFKNVNDNLNTDKT